MYVCMYVCMFPLVKINRKPSGFFRMLSVELTDHTFKLLGKITLRNSTAVSFRQDGAVYQVKITIIRPFLGHLVYFTCSWVLYSAMLLNHNFAGFSADRSCADPRRSVVASLKVVVAVNKLNSPEAFIRHIFFSK